MGHPDSWETELRIAVVRALPGPKIRTLRGNRSLFTLELKMLQPTKIREALLAFFTGGLLLCVVLFVGFVH